MFHASGVFRIGSVRSKHNHPWNRHCRPRHHPLDRPTLSLPLGSVGHVRLARPNSPLDFPQSARQDITSRRSTQLATNKSTTMPETAITPTSPPSSGPTSPPRGLTHSPSIFGYQERLLQRTSSVRSGTSLSLLAAPEKPAPAAAPSMPVASSPPSTPIRATVSRMISHPEEKATSRPSTVGSSAHRRGAQSVDQTKGLWENRISNAAKSEASPPTHRSKRSIDVFSPPLPSSSTLSSVASTSPSVRTPSTIINTPDLVSKYDTARYQTPSKRSTISNFEGLDVSKVVESPAMAERTPSDRASRIRPASISSMSSIVTPQATGSSGGSSVRTPAMEDKLAQARANALRRRQEREGLATPAKAGEMLPPPPVPSIMTPSTSTSSSIPPSPVLASSANASFAFSDKVNTGYGTSVSTSTPIPTIKASSSPSMSTGSASKLASLSKLFEATSVSDTRTRSSPGIGSDATPASMRGGPTRSIVTPPSAPAPRYVPSGLSSYSTPRSVASNTASSSSGSSPAGLSAPTSGGKYGSISKSDNRRLGRHLPRIASGGEGWDEEEVPAKKSVRRVPSNLSRNESVVLPSSLGDISGSPKPAQTEKAEPLGPSRSDNVPAAQSPSVPSTPASKRRSYVLHTPKEGLSTPRAEVAGEEMRGLMSAVGSTSVRGGTAESGEGVTGELLEYGCS